MEYIDGEPLDEAVKKGPMALEEAVRLVTQVAQALELAHENNIVHRDIKAANVMLTSKGEAKVLDFGLAKTAHSTMLTRMGSTLGTVAYMSPEQARGENVDHRTDLWALGVLMYELIAGRLPFGGDYEQAVTYSIINEDPQPLTAIRTGVPMSLEWIVSKLIAKKAGDRYQSARDLIVDLRTVDLTQEGMSRTTTVKSMPAVAAGPAKRNPLDLRARMSVPAILAAMALGAFASWIFTRPSAPELQPSQVTEIHLPEIRNPIYVESTGDGRALVIMGQDSTLAAFFTYLYDTETEELRILNQNTGDRYFFSPDQSELAYRQGVHMYRMSVLGGAPTQVGRFGSGWPEWTAEGGLIFDWNESLWLYPGDGSAARQISQVDSLAGEGGHYNADVLPDGRHAIMHITRTTGEVRQLAILDMKTGEHRSIGNGASARYLVSGHLLYVDGSASAQGQMLIRPFDADKLQWSGPPAVLQEQGNIGQWAFDRYMNAYQLNRSPQFGPGVGQRYRFVEIDPTSRNETPFAAPEGTLAHTVSPDGRLMVVAIDGDNDGTPSHFVLLDRIEGISQRLPFDGARVDIQWTTDSKGIYVGIDRELQLWSVETIQMINSWTTQGFVSTFDVAPDGRTMVYVNHPRGDWGVMRVINLETGEDRQLTDEPFVGPRFSPDGRYVIAGNLQLDLNVVSLDNGSTQMLAPSSFFWEWADNGRIYYRQGQDIQWVQTSTEPAFRITGQEQTLTTFPGLYTFSIDGRGRLVAMINNATDGNGVDIPTVIRVFSNWDQRALELAPPTD